MGHPGHCWGGRRRSLRRVGLFDPLGAAGILGAMAMATFKTHWKNGFWLSKGGYEYSLVLSIVSIAIGLIGPGSYSLDTLFGINLPQALLFSLLAVAALLVDAIGILSSRPGAVAPAREDIQSPLPRHSVS